MNQTNCHTCLSPYRKLKPIKPQVEYLFTMLCPEMCFMDYSQYLICWECEFMIDKIKIFQNRLTKANNTLKLCIKGKTAILKELSSLKLTGIETISITPQSTPTFSQNTSTLSHNIATLPQDALTFPQNTPTFPQKTPTIAQNTPTLPQNTSKLRQKKQTLQKNKPFSSLKEMLAAPLRLDSHAVVVKEEDETRSFDGDYENLIQPAMLQHHSKDPLMIPTQNKTEINKTWVEIEVPRKKPIKYRNITPIVNNVIPQKVFINTPKEDMTLRGLREPVKVTGTISNIPTGKEITPSWINREESSPVVKEKTESRILNLDKLLTRLLSTPSKHDELFIMKQVPSTTGSKEPESQQGTSASGNEDVAKCIILNRTELNAARDKRKSNPAYTTTQFKCERCIEWFQSKEKLDEHNKKHDESQGSLICEICEQRFADDRVLDEHFKQHFIVYGCLQCPYQNADRVKLSQHVHKNHEESSFFCRQCHTDFKTYKERSSHRFKAHNKKIKCEECGKTILKSQLKMHMANVHRGETVECPICKKKVRKYNLKGHMKTHDEKRPDAAYCLDCGTSYKSKFTYELHLKNSLKHNTIEKLGIKCQHCDKYFSSRQSLKNHEEEVNGVTYICDICKKEYKSKITLIRHIQSVHEGVKPKHNRRICEICGNSFINKKSLEEHINRHLGRRPHVCKDCGATFIYAAALFTHRRLVHKVKRKFEMTS